LEDQITIGASDEVPHKQTDETDTGFCKRAQDAWFYQDDRQKRFRKT